MLHLILWTPLSHSLTGTFRFCVINKTENCTPILSKQIFYRLAVTLFQADDRSVIETVAEL